VRFWHSRPSPSPPSGQRSWQEAPPAGLGGFWRWALSAAWASSAGGDSSRREGVPATSFAPRAWWRPGFRASTSTSWRRSSCARHSATPTPFRRSWPGPTSRARTYAPRRWTHGTWWMAGPPGWPSSSPPPPSPSSPSAPSSPQAACGRWRACFAPPRGRRHPAASPSPGTSSSPTATRPTSGFSRAPSPAREGKFRRRWGRWWSCGRARTGRW
jgi:hypothetical protein